MVLGILFVDATRDGKTPLTWARLTVIHSFGIKFIEIKKSS